MKVLFLGILLVNIVFFFWEYRKGAPDIYLPPNYDELIDSVNVVQQIMLLSEVQDAAETTENDTPSHELFSESPQQSIGDSASLKVPEPDILTGKDLVGLQHTNRQNELVESEQSQATFIQAETEKTQRTTDFPGSMVETCYRLKAGEYSLTRFSQEIEQEGFQLELLERQQSDITQYLLLTSAANSLQEALNSEQNMKQLGINDTQLFRQGLYKWRISLGLFNQLEQAKQAKELFASQTDQELHLVPNNQSNSFTYVKVSINELYKLSDFENKFAAIVERKIACSEDKLSVSVSENDTL